MSRGTGEDGACCQKGGPRGAGLGDVGGSPMTLMFLRSDLFSKVDLFLLSESLWDLDRRRDANIVIFKMYRTVLQLWRSDLFKLVFK